MTDNASWSSKKWEEKVKKDARIKFLKEYDETHVACPECGSINVGCHTAPSFTAFPDQDTNKAWCLKCKWQGIVHDLVAASKPAQK